MEFRELLGRELSASPSSERLKSRPLRLSEVAQLPITKADLANETADFAAACERAERRGDRALELLRAWTPGKFGDAKPEDYEVSSTKKGPAHA
jgi:hypothetical protein